MGDEHCRHAGHADDGDGPQRSHDLGVDAAAQGVSSVDSRFVYGVIAAETPKGKAETPRFALDCGLPALIYATIRSISPSCAFACRYRRFLLELFHYSGGEKATPVGLPMG
jgi:hypothetical protein